MSTLQLAASAVHDPIQAIGVLHAIRNAVIAILVIVFVLGMIVGFLLARAIYRHRGTSGDGYAGPGAANPGYASPPQQQYPGEHPRRQGPHQRP